MSCLEDKDADVSVQDKFGSTLVHVALETSQLHIAERIIKTGKVAIDALDSRKRTALRRALELKSEAVALACLEAGATAAAADPDKQVSVVHLVLQNFTADAAVSSHLVVRLIRAGSLVSGQDAKGWSVLARMADQQRDDCLHAGLKQILKPLGTYKMPVKKAAAWIMSGQENADVRHRADCLAELPGKVRALDSDLTSKEAEDSISQLLAGTDSRTVLGLSAQDVISRMHNPEKPEMSDPEDEPKPLPKSPSKSTAQPTPKVTPKETEEPKPAPVPETAPAKTNDAPAAGANDDGNAATKKAPASDDAKAASSSIAGTEDQEESPSSKEAKQDTKAEAQSSAADNDSEDFEDDFEDDN